MAFSDALHVNRPGSLATHSPRPVLGLMEAASNFKSEGATICACREQATSEATAMPRVFLLLAGTLRPEILMSTQYQTAAIFTLRFPAH